MEGEGRGVGFAGFDGACEEVEGEELHFVGLVTEVGLGFGAFELRRFVVECVVLADTFGAGRFATNKFWPRMRACLSPSPVEPIRASPTGRPSKLGRYAKTIDCGREGTVETQLPVGPIKAVR